MINNQPPSKQTDNPKLLEVTEIFDTIQGEGPLSGYPATFVRLAGCNLQCTWCDTIYNTVDYLTPADIVARVNHKIVVITGGEPLRQNLEGLLRMLYNNGLTVQIETNGTIYSSAAFIYCDYIVVSPKTSAISKQWLLLAQQHTGRIVIKAVIGDEAFPSQPGDKGGDPLENITPDIVMPLDSGNELENEHNKALAVEYVMKHDCRLQLQIHKELGLK